MANHYTQLCAKVPLSEEAVIFTISLVGALDILSAGTALDDDSDDIEAFVTAETVFEKDDTKEPLLIDIETVEDGIIITAEEPVNLTMLGNMLEAVAKKFEIPNPIGIEYAFTSDRATPDAFGGGLMIITKNGQHHMTTNNWMDMKIKELKEQAENREHPERVLDALYGSGQ